MTVCAVCKARAHDGYLCPKCLTSLREALTEVAPGTTHLPSYAAGRAGRATSTPWDLPTAVLVGGLAEHLDVAITRQARIGTSGPSSREKPTPFHGPSAAVRGYLVRTLAPWALFALQLERPTVDSPACRHRDPVGADCPPCADAAARHSARWARWARQRAAVEQGDLGATATYLRARLHLLTVREEAGHLHQAVVPAVNRALEVIDRPADQWYAGRCGHETAGVLCDRALYSDPDAAFVTCDGCDHTWSVADRRAELLKGAEDHLDTATRIATALTSLDKPVTPDRIWKWKQREKLRVHGTDDDDRPLYRVGDVLDLLAAESRRTRKAAS